MAENGHKVGVGWPSWRYPPDGGPGAIFERSLDVPPGWLERQPRKRTAEEMIAEEMKKTVVVMPAAPQLIVPDSIKLARTPRKLRSPTAVAPHDPWPTVEPTEAT